MAQFLEISALSPKQLEYSPHLTEYEISQPVKSNHPQNTQTLRLLSPSELDPHAQINILLATNKRKVNFLWPYFQLYYSIEITLSQVTVRSKDHFLFSMLLDFF